MSSNAKTLLQNASTLMRENLFPFGAQYLRGLMPQRKDWDRDMGTMRSLGFNTIRAWLVWGTLEPRPGEVDAERIVAFLDLAKKHELNVGLLFHLHGCPEWASRQYRRYWYQDECGHAFEPAARANTPSGGWPGLCFDHAEVCQLERSFIEKVTLAVNEHPALSFWEPMNEPHQWIDHARTPPGIYCYCEATRNVFIEWLRNKYKTLENLNDAWGRRCGVWEEVRPPTWRFGFSDWCDWRTFTAENISALVNRRAAIINEVSRKPIVAHAWGGSCVLCPELGSMAFDDWKNAESTAIWGDSAFAQGPSSTVLVGLGATATRSAAAERPFWQAELGVADYHGGLLRTGRLPAKWLEMWSWESIRQGAKGLLYWQFRKERHGSESGAYGLTDYGGNPTENANAVASIGAVLRENMDLFANTKLPPARIALLFSYQSYMMVWSQLRSCQLSVNALSGYYRIFWERNLSVDIIHEEFSTAETLSQYSMVILPMPIAIGAGIRTALKDYIIQGGHVLSDPALCAYDSHKRLDDEVPGDGMAQVFGCRERDIMTVKEAVAVKWNERNILIEQSHFKSLWDLNGATPIAYYDDGEPAIISHQWGRGVAIMSGINLGIGISPKEVLGDDVEMSGRSCARKDIGDMIMKLALTAGVNTPFSTPEGIVAGMLRHDDGRQILITINTNPGLQHGFVRMDDYNYRKAIDLIKKTSLEVNNNSIELHWEGYETHVLLLII